jgi:hypothetical protein
MSSFPCLFLYISFVEQPNKFFCKIQHCWVTSWMNVYLIRKNSANPMFYIGCPTTYQTRQFFNNSKTNEDIATRFEQEYVRCVKNEKQCVCSKMSVCVCSKIIKELPGLVGSGTPYTIKAKPIQSEATVHFNCLHSNWSNSFSSTSLKLTNIPKTIYFQ